MLHAHSHTALLGWIYLGIITLIYKNFLKEAGKPKRYKQIFIVTNISIIGMIFTFPFQGYALFSIIFSTLFLFASYWFAGFAMKNIPARYKSRFSWKLMKASLWYLVISSLGAWAIGVVMATLGSTSIWYKTSIYFFLHFQYNGWFIPALIGLLFYFFEEKNVVFNPEKLQSFYLLLNFGIILSFFLSALWFKPPVFIYILAFVGAVSQCMAFAELYDLLKKHLIVLKKTLWPPLVLLLKIAGWLLLAKIGMQLLSAHPYIAALVTQLKYFVIGYLHMVFLGVIIPVMLVLLNYYNLIRLSKSFVFLYLITVAITEILIFYFPAAVWLGLPLFKNQFLLLTILSFLFPVAVSILFYQSFSGPKKQASLLNK